MESQTKMEKNSKQLKKYTTYMKLLNTDGSSSQCDVTFKTVDGGLIHVHKSFLSERCEYFEKMFYGGFKECNQSVIYIELSYSVLAGLIKFIYTGKMPKLTEENVDEMLYGSDLYFLDSVHEECVNFLMDSIDDDNCFIIKDIAQFRRLPSLSIESSKYALRNFMTVSHCPSFLDAKVAYVSKLVDSKFLIVNQELDVFDAIIRWVKHDENNRKQHLAGLLRKMKLIFIVFTYLSEILHEPLIKENPECTQIFKDVYNRFYLNDKDGNLRDQERQRNNRWNPYPPRKPLLPRFKNDDENSPCYGESVIDIAAMLNENLSEEFQKIEWNLSMNEMNFLYDWDKKWEDHNI